MPTTKKRVYCIKCNSRKVKDRTILIVSNPIKKRYSETMVYNKYYICIDCATRLRDYLNKII